MKADQVTHRPYPAAFWVKHAAAPLATTAASLPPDWAPLPYLTMFLGLLVLNLVLTCVSTFTGEPDLIARQFPEPASGAAWATRAQIGERLGGPGSPVRARRLRVLLGAFALMLGGTALLSAFLEGDALGRGLLIGLALVDLWHADQQRRLTDIAAASSPAIARLVA